ncbi:hypothetical protein ACIHAR_10395 [Streptomyces sp. NPDC052016]|uniref:hypothetical protein n=1 Tax=Streptomyces sp. NPDC052016 TaxID=3365680 RepID=UPI0037CCFFA1
MRRTARVLSVAALAGAVLAGGAPAASADPTAETGPATAAPDGSVTVSVACDPIGVPAPRTVDATSEAFAEGTVRLTLVPGDDELSGPAYRGTARIAPADDLDVPEAAAGTGSAWTVDGVCPAPPDGKAARWSTTFDVSRDDEPACAPSGGAGCEGDEEKCTPHGAGCEEDEPECTPSHGAGCEDGEDGEEKCGPSHGANCEDGEDGEEKCDPSHGTGCEDGVFEAYDDLPDGEDGEEKCTPSHGANCEDGTTCAQGHGEDCAKGESCSWDHGKECGAEKPCREDHGDPGCTGAPAVRHGVHAGAGGAFGGSVPALAAGGLLIAGALGAAVHRLCRRDPAEDV